MPYRAGNPWHPTLWSRTSEPPSPVVVTCDSPLLDNPQMRNLGEVLPSPRPVLLVWGHVSPLSLGSPCSDWDTGSTCSYFLTSFCAMRHHLPRVQIPVLTSPLSPATRHGVHTQIPFPCLCTTVSDPSIATSTAPCVFIMQTLPLSSPSINHTIHLGVLEACRPLLRAPVCDSLSGM